MRTMNTLMGQDLLSLGDGRRLGSVKDLIVDPEHHRILGLVVEEPGLLSSGAIVAADSIHSFGKDAIVISDAGAVRDPASLPEIAEAMRKDGTLVGMHVFSDTGEEQGSVADVYFDEGTSRIVGFKISDGLLDGAAHGPRFLSADQVDHFGDEIIYVRPEVAESLAEQDGHDQEMAPGLAQGVADAVASARATVDGAIDARQARLENGEDLAGRRSGADVTAPDGSLVLVTGQRIDESHLAWAREHDAVEALRAAADVWDAAERERVLGSTVEGLRDAAGSVWDRFLGAVADMTDASGRRMSEEQTKERLRRINDAVGRPVTKVILDRDDDVILDLGDIITHQAIQRAYEAGLLDTLLDSVYTADVAFERDEMKASVPASSTVAQSSGGAALVSELQEQVSRSEQERREAAERERRESVEARSQRDKQRAERASRRAEASRAASDEPALPTDVPVVVTSSAETATAAEGDRDGESSGGSASVLDGGFESDRGVSGDAPAEGRQMDLPGADRDEQVADEADPLGDQAARDGQQRSDGPPSTARGRL